MKIMTIGTFDLLHAGHLNLLRTVRSLSGNEQFHVGVNSDEYVVSKGKPRPVQNYANRIGTIWTLSNLLYTQEYASPIVAIQYDGEDVIKLLRRTGCDTLVVGSDWASKDYWAQIDCPAEKFFSNGFRLIYVPYTQGISTTALREACQQSLQS